MVRRGPQEVPHDDDVGRRLLVHARYSVTCLKVGHLLSSSVAVSLMCGREYTVIEYG